MLVNILGRFATEFNKDKCMINDPLRTSEVSIANFLFAYDDKDLPEYNKFVGGMRPLNGVGMLLRFVDGDKKNFIKMMMGSNMNSTKNKDTIGWGYREIYTHPIVDNWLEHYNNGRKFAVFNEKESTKVRSMYENSKINDETIDEIKDIYSAKGGDALWSDMASHVIAQELNAVYNLNNSSISLDNFENILAIAKAACNGVKKNSMFEISNRLRSPADMAIFKTFVNSSSFANYRPVVTNDGKTFTSKGAGEEDVSGAGITVGRLGYVKEDSNCYLNDYLKAKSKSVRGGGNRCLDKEPTIVNEQYEEDIDDGPVFKL
jgi:hypothetical protein